MFFLRRLLLSLCVFISLSPSLLALSPRNGQFFKLAYDSYCESLTNLELAALCTQVLKATNLDKGNPFVHGQVSRSVQEIQGYAQGNGSLSSLANFSGSLVAVLNANNNSSENIRKHIGFVHLYLLEQYAQKFPLFDLGDWQTFLSTVVKLNSVLTEGELAQVGNYSQIMDIILQFPWHQFRLNELGQKYFAQISAASPLWKSFVEKKGLTDYWNLMIWLELLTFQSLQIVTMDELDQVVPNSPDTIHRVDQLRSDGKISDSQWLLLALFAIEYPEYWDLVIQGVQQRGFSEDLMPLYSMACDTLENSDLPEETKQKLIVFLNREFSPFLIEGLDSEKAVLGRLRLDIQNDVFKALGSAPQSDAQLAWRDIHKKVYTQNPLWDHYLRFLSSYYLSYGKKIGVVLDGPHGVADLQMKTCLAYLLRDFALSLGVSEEFQTEILSRSSQMIREVQRGNNKIDMTVVSLFMVHLFNANLEEIPQGVKPLLALCVHDFAMLFQREGHPMWSFQSLELALRLGLDTRALWTSYTVLTNQLFSLTRYTPELWDYFEKNLPALLEQFPCSPQLQTSSRYASQRLGLIDRNMTRSVNCLEHLNGFQELANLWNSPAHKAFADIMNRQQGGLLNPPEVLNAFDDALESPDEYSILEKLLLDVLQYQAYTDIFANDPEDNNAQQTKWDYLLEVNRSLLKLFEEDVPDDPENSPEQLLMAISQINFWQEGNSVISKGVSAEILSMILYDTILGVSFLDLENPWVLAKPLIKNFTQHVRFVGHHQERYLQTLWKILSAYQPFYHLCVEEDWSALFNLLTPLIDSHTFVVSDKYNAANLDPQIRQMMVLLVQAIYDCAYLKTQKSDSPENSRPFLKKQWQWLKGQIPNSETLSMETVENLSNYVFSLGYAFSEEYTQEVLGPFIQLIYPRLPIGERLRFARLVHLNLSKIPEIDQLENLWKQCFKGFPEVLIYYQYIISPKFSLKALKNLYEKFHENHAEQVSFLPELSDRMLMHVYDYAMAIEGPLVWIPGKSLKTVYKNAGLVLSGDWDTQSLINHLGDVVAAHKPHGYVSQRISPEKFDSLPFYDLQKRWPAQFSDLQPLEENVFVEYMDQTADSWDGPFVLGFSDDIRNQFKTSLTRKWFWQRLFNPSYDDYTHLRDAQLDNLIRWLTESSLLFENSFIDQTSKLYLHFLAIAEKLPHLQHKVLLLRLHRALSLSKPTRNLWDTFWNNQERLSAEDAVFVRNLCVHFLMHEGPLPEGFAKAFLLLYERNYFYHEDRLLLLKLFINKLIDQALQTSGDAQQGELLLNLFDKVQEVSDFQSLKPERFDQARDHLMRELDSQAEQFRTDTINTLESFADHIVQGEELQRWVKDVKGNRRYQAVAEQSLAQTLLSLMMRWKHLKEGNEFEHNAQLQQQMKVLWNAAYSLNVGFQAWPWPYLQHVMPFYLGSQRWQAKEHRAAWIEFWNKHGEQFDKDFDASDRAEHLSDERRYYFKRILHYHGSNAKNFTPLERRVFVRALDGKVPPQLKLLLPQRLDECRKYPQMLRIYLEQTDPQKVDMNAFVDDFAEIFSEEAFRSQRYWEDSLALIEIYLNALSRLGRDFTPRKMVMHIHNLRKIQSVLQNRGVQDPEIFMKVQSVLNYLTNPQSLRAIHDNLLSVINNSTHLNTCLTMLHENPDYQFLKTLDGDDSLVYLSVMLSLYRIHSQNQYLSRQNFTDIMCRLVAGKQEFMTKPLADYISQEFQKNAQYLCESLERLLSDMNWLKELLDKQVKLEDLISETISRLSLLYEICAGYRSQDIGDFLRELNQKSLQIYTDGSDQFLKTTFKLNDSFMSHWQELQKSA